MQFEHEIVRLDGDVDIVDIEIKITRRYAGPTISFFEPSLAGEYDFACYYDGYEVTARELAKLVGADDADHYIESTLDKADEDFFEDGDYDEGDRYVV
jgi:hypothetical protein